MLTAGFKSVPCMWRGNSEWLLFGPVTEVIYTPRFRDTFDHIHGFKCAVYVFRETESSDT